MNSDSYNLGDSLLVGIDDGTLMRLALETCRDLTGFETLLDSTNAVGRIDCWNIGCLDSTGAGAVYECANRSYVKCVPYTRQRDPRGYVIRANFSVTGGLNRTGFDRHKRALGLTQERAREAPIDAGFVLERLARDLGNIFDDPYPLPYNGSQLNAPAGYIYNLGVTIANRSTTSAVVIRGVKPGENARLTTIFAMVGNPVLSVAFPMWVSSGCVPEALSRTGGCPVYQLCQQRTPLLYDYARASLHLNSHYLLDDDGEGVYSYTLPLEAWGIAEADLAVAEWSYAEPSCDRIRHEQSRIAGAIFAGFLSETTEPIDDIPGAPIVPVSISLYNYPNPFNEGTVIRYAGADVRYPVTVTIFDLLGRRLLDMTYGGSPAGAIYWAGRDASDLRVASGVFLCTIRNGPYEASNVMIYQK
jgi:hypothetical protein